MAGASVQVPRTSEVEGSVKQCEGNLKAGSISDDAGRHRVRSNSAAASSSSSSGSSQPGPSRRMSIRRPDGNSEETGPSDLESLEKVLRRESIVDVIEVANLTLPATPLRTPSGDSVDGNSIDVRINLELASEALSKLPPAD